MSSRPPAAPIRVVVAHDDRLLHESIGRPLDRQPDIDVVAYATDDEEVVSQCEKFRPHVALIALHPPSFNAAAMAVELHVGGGRVIGIAADLTDREIFEALRAGIDGLLRKRCSSDELVNAVRVVARGDAVLAPSITRRLVDHYSHPAISATSVTAAYQLTAREIDVFRRARHRDNEHRDRRTATDERDHREIPRLSPTRQDRLHNTTPSRRLRLPHRTTHHQQRTNRTRNLNWTPSTKTVAIAAGTAAGRLTIADLSLARAPPTSPPQHRALNSRIPRHASPGRALPMR